MADDLNFKGIFGAPFSSQTLSFPCFANGTIPLVVIEPVISVPLWARGFLRVYVRQGGAIFHDVFSTRFHVEMLWVNTRMISASMVDDKTIRYGAVNREPRYSVRAPVSATEVKSSVAIFIQWAGPQRAAVRLLCYFSEKTIKLFKRKVHGGLFLLTPTG